MLGKATIVIAWFQLTLIVLIINLTYLSAKIKGGDTSITYPYTQISAQINAPASTGKVLGASIVSDDARNLLIKQFIKNVRPSSPLLSYVDTIITEADKNTIDFRLVPAIAMCESNLGDHLPSSDSFNAWGIAVFTGQNHGKKFEDWPSAIAWVSKFLKESFYDKGITDLREIGAIWAPPSVEKEYSWTRCVESFMTQMQ